MKTPRELAESALQWMDINNASENDRRVLAMAFHNAVTSAKAEATTFNYTIRAKVAKAFEDKGYVMCQESELADLLGEYAMVAEFYIEPEGDKQSTKVYVMKRAT